jgi:hypothetical protein
MSSLCVCFFILKFDYFIKKIKNKRRKKEKKKERKKEDMITIA